MIKKKYLSNKKIFHITLNRNNVNSININLLDELLKVLLDIDKQTVCLIISSSSKHFCAGADLKERGAMDYNETIDFLNKINNVNKVISELSILTIASINGACLGGGLELALSCDFRIANRSSLFGFPEVSIGIIPGAGGTQRLTRLIGISKSMKWIFTADRFTAQQAREDGVVDFVVADKNLKYFTSNFCNKILANAPIALKVSKSSILSVFIDSGFKSERSNYIKTLNSKDRDEGLLSFKENRSPDWKNS